jgi:hypothetical protein
MRTKLFPIALITLDLCAAVMYSMDYDLRRAIYWVSAAVLTATVTF